MKNLWLRAKYLLHPLFFGPKNNTVGRFSFYARFIQGTCRCRCCHVSVTLSRLLRTDLYFWDGGKVWEFPNFLHSKNSWKNSTRGTIGKKFEQVLSTKVRKIFPALENCSSPLPPPPRPAPLIPGHNGPSFTLLQVITSPLNFEETIHSHKRQQKMGGTFSFFSSLAIPVFACWGVSTAIGVAIQYKITASNLNSGSSLLQFCNCCDRPRPDRWHITSSTRATQTGQSLEHIDDIRSTC